MLSRKAFAVSLVGLVDEIARSVAQVRASGAEAEGVRWRMTLSRLGLSLGQPCRVAVARLIGEVEQSFADPLVAKLPPDLEFSVASFASFVMLMASLMLAREGAAVVGAILPALPTTWPQVAVSVGLLVLGTAAGRGSIRAERRHAELVLTEGAGI